MNGLNLILTTLLICLISPNLRAQCVTASADSTIECGYQMQISAYGFSGGAAALASDFNSSTIGPGWATTSPVLFTNPCGPSLDGTPSAWIGNSILPRLFTTNAFDLSCGAHICFDLDYGAEDPCGGCTDCEDPDQPSEGVFFSYSIDGGTTWVDLHYFQPTPSNTTAYYQWNNYCFILPPEAWTTATMFRWRQFAISSQIHDHWGLDNVFVIPANCNYWYDWAHIPGFPDSPNQVVSPGDTTTYYVSYTNGTNICFDSVVVNVLPMEIDIVANPNPIDCGSCADLSVDFVSGADGSYSDDFDPGIDPFLWGDIQVGALSTICGGGATGNALYFNGPGVNRYAQTSAIDATSCGNIEFCLYMGNIGSGGAPCENNETGDDIVLEYSINGGTTFVPIATYLQSLWDGANYQQCFSTTMPAAAQTTSTIFRWRQVAFGPFNGSDNWSLDEVFISCYPSTISYNWTTGILNNATSPTPVACQIADDLYTVSVVNSLIGCSATDTTTLFVNPCSCAFLQFTGTVSNQLGGIVDVSGTFQYASSPTTGTLVVEATNGTGTYTQVFNPPFTDSLIYDFLITGILNDSSTITLNVYFTDSVTCNFTFDIVFPSDCDFIQFDGALTSQSGGLLDVNGIFEYASSPSTGTLVVVATNGTGTYSQTFNPPFVDSLVYNYSITGIPNDGSMIVLVIYFDDSLNCGETFGLMPTVNIQGLVMQDNGCIFAPNPMFDKALLMFNNENHAEVTITILNERGELVFDTTTKEKFISINGNQMSQGVYFYTVKSGDAGEDCKGKFAVTK